MSSTELPNILAALKILLAPLEKSFTFLVVVVIILTGYNKSIAIGPPPNCTIKTIENFMLADEPFAKACEFSKLVY